MRHQPPMADESTDGTGLPVRGEHLGHASTPRAGRRRWVRWIVKWGSVAVLVVIVAYLAIAVWLSRLEPTIAFDPLERANALIPSAAEDARAWPLYRQATEWLRERRAHRLPLVEGAFIDPGATDEDRATLAEVLRERQVEIAALRRAASMPTLGVRLERTLDPADQALVLGTDGAATGPARVLFAVQLPHLSVLREVVRLLCADSALALDVGDGERAVDDLVAAVGVARHAAQLGLLIAQLVESSMLLQAAEQAVRAIERMPDAIATDDLQRLQRAFEAIAPDAWRAQMTFERIAIADFIQHSFSDDGSGDGVLLPRAMMEIAGDDISGPTTGFLMAPLAAATLAGRQETADLAERLFGLMEAEQGTPIATRADTVRRELRSMDRDRRSRIRNAVMLVMMPAITKADVTRAVTRTTVDGAVVAIAIECWRRARGEWPASLDDLVPQFLRAVPADAYDGQPIRYRLDPDGPLLWSVGPDGVDDAGAPARSPHDLFAAYREQPNGISGDGGDAGQAGNSAVAAAQERRRRPRFDEEGDYILFDARAH